ncbi:MAG: NCS2 family permease, partial [Chlamydiia bacterium]|nr:NCS2 family permease [Chlamydiia bacterium]
MYRILDRFFRLSEHQTTVKREILAGVTTFSTMAYILFVNPSILSEAGMDAGAVMVATAASAAISTLIMGLYANYPFVLAPGMGLNAYFTYGVCLGLGYSWQTALGAVFWSGGLFLLLNLLRIRQLIACAVPTPLRLAVAAGMGLF